MVGRKRIDSHSAAATLAILPRRTHLRHTVNCFQMRKRRKKGIVRRIVLKTLNSYSKRCKVVNCGSPFVTAVTPLIETVQWLEGSTSDGPAATESW